MPRQAAGKENVRKLGTTGAAANPSYFVTLPIKLVRELGWRDGHKLVIKASGTKLVIEDWKE
jgi:hypothetical protein